jgi:hypothetical protein
MQPGSQQQKFIRDIIADYGRAAQAKLLVEFGQVLAPLIVKGRREKATLERD